MGRAWGHRRLLAQPAGATLVNAPLAVAEWGGKNKPFRLETRVPLIHLRGHSYSHDRLWEYAGGHEGFYGWLRVVNRRIERKLFLNTAWD